MTQGLTSRQREVLAAIEALAQPRRVPPSYAEIAGIAGGSAVSVMHVVHRLAARGYVSFTPDKHRTIRVLRPLTAEARALEAAAAP